MRNFAVHEYWGVELRTIWKTIQDGLPPLKRTYFYMKLISLLIFDLGNVLLDLNFELFVNSVSEISTRDSQDIRNRYLIGDRKRDYERGRISSKNFIKEMAEWLALPTSEHGILKKLWCNVFIRVPEAESSITRLSERYDLWLLSDTNDLHWEYLINNYQIFQKFSRHFLSFKRGLLKSDPGAFDDILDEAGYPGERIMFFDDLPENVAAAKKKGITAHQFFSWQKLNQKIQ